MIRQLCYHGHMKSYAFRAIIEPDGKGFHAFVPLLPGLHTYGKSMTEAKSNLREATLCHLHGLQKDGEKIPREEDAYEVMQTFSIGEVLA